MKKIKLVKGGIMSEFTGRFVLLQKDILNLYPKLLHPEHGQWTSRESFFSKIRKFWAWADKLG